MDTYFFRTIITVTNATAMILPIAEAAKYISFDGTIVAEIGAGVGVAP